MPSEPLVVAHRGASGHRPEHTLAAYRLAVRQGADFIEPDLVPTRDGHLVARHESEISGTTDVADRRELAGRRTTKVVDGREVTGWFTEDLTLAELKTLRARERLPGLRPRNARYDGLFEVPTFDEVLELARQEGLRAGRRVGVYPEIKHPTHFAALGLPVAPLLVEALQRHGLDDPFAPVLVQSFEPAGLQELASLTRVPLVQLLDVAGAPYDLVAAGDPRTYDALATPAGLAAIAGYAAAIGAHKDRVLPREPSAGDPGRTPPLVGDAHSAGLRVHVWTVRHENEFLAARFRRGNDPAGHGAADAEVRALLDAGVDGIFTDHPGTALHAIAGWRAAAEATA